MLATVPSATLVGLAGRVIRVEVDVAPGLPGFTIVGLADAALQEARERVRGALRNAGFEHPPRRITVNLAPAELRKAGASLDLAIALGILLGFGAGPARRRPLGADRRAVARRRGAPGPGILPMVDALARRGYRRVVVPAAAAAEARLVERVELAAVETIGDVVERVRQPAIAPRRRQPATDRAGRRAPPSKAARPSRSPMTGRSPDLSEVRGQLEARRGLEIALAGGHGIVFVGPPGSGKTLLARTIPGLLPPLDDAAALEVTVVASAAGERSDQRAHPRRRRSVRRTTRPRTRRWSAAGRACRPAR